MRHFMQTLVVGTCSTLVLTTSAFGQSKASLDDLVMYGVDAATHELIRYRMGADGYEVVDSIRLPGGTVITELESLGYIPGQKHLYGVWNYLGNSQSKLVRIDLFTAQATPLPIDTGFGNIEGLVAVCRKDGGDRGGDDPGLEGGHFDVDTFSGISRTFHEHEYDDKNDVKFVDLVNSPSLSAEWSTILSGYGSVRISFKNAHNGSGTYTITTGTDEWSGNTRDGGPGTISVDPADITSLRLDFRSLAEFRGTEPGNVRDDDVDRDDAMCVNVADAGGNLIYQFSVYEHVKKDGGKKDGGGGDGGDGGDGDDNDRPRHSDGQWMLYGVHTDSGAKSALIQIYPKTGLAESVMALSRRYEGLAHSGSSENLFIGVSDRELWAIDISAGTETFIGEDDYYDIEALEFAMGVADGLEMPGLDDSFTAGGVLFGFSDRDNSLLLINPDTGEAFALDTAVNSTDLEGMVFLTIKMDPVTTMTANSYD